jgi:hypothetical protein
MPLQIKTITSWKDNIIAVGIAALGLSLTQDNRRSNYK